MKKQGESEILIFVQEPQINTIGQKYVTYLIRGKDKNGQFSVRRRYNDFYFLRQQLVDRWMGLYIPPISSKKATVIIQLSRAINNKNLSSKEKGFFTTFALKSHKDLTFFYPEEFQLFLRNNVDLQKTFKQLPPVDFKSRLEVYQTYFKNCCENFSEVEILLMNETGYDYLKKVQKKYENIREEFKTVAQTKKNYANQFVHIFHDVLQEYEEKFFLLPIGRDREKLIISKVQVKAQIKEYQSLTNHNPLEDYVEMISYELRQARAIIEVIQTRKKTEQMKQRLERKRIQSKEKLDKLQSEKQTFKYFFSLGNKKQQIEQLQKQIFDLDLQIDCFNRLIPLMNAACHFQIKAYKSKREKQYLTILKDVAQKQIKKNCLHTDVFSKYLLHSSITDIENILLLTLSYQRHNNYSTQEILRFSI